MTTWREFWDSAHSIYVNERHKDVHYRDVAEQLAAFVPGPDARVLDLRLRRGDPRGPGRGARRDLLLCDVGAERARRDRGAVCRQSEHQGDRAGGRRAPARREPRSRSSRTRWCSISPPTNSTACSALWRRLLAPGGTLIVADVIPPHVGTVSDGFALLRYAAANGFLGAALVGLTRTALSRYRGCAARSASRATARRSSSTSCARPGFSAERLAKNVEHNPARMTFRARLAPVSTRHRLTFALPFGCGCAARFGIMARPGGGLETQGRRNAFQAWFKSRPGPPTFLLQLRSSQSIREGTRSQATCSRCSPPCRPSRRRARRAALPAPTVESRAVWCSISELSSAPTSTTMVEIHIHIIKPITAPSEP